MSKQSDENQSKPLRRILCIVVSSLLISVCVVTAKVGPSNRSTEINKLMETLHERGQFNGAILVAKKGAIIYRNGFGKANFQTGVDFAPETPSNIGSLTKQFTAMGVMILAERKRLSYDDAISKYIPEFSGSAHFEGITLRHLLTHTSGIPDYGDLGIDDSTMDQHGLIAALIGQGRSFGTPGLKYRYSNPGYGLLAILIERVSGKHFGDFLREAIFLPAGMNNTFLYDRTRAKSPNAAPGYDQFGSLDDSGPTAIPGDGGLYSTVDDLFKWDQVMYTEKLVSRSTLSEAYTPGHVEEGNSCYGFGWNVEERGGGKYLWHTGSHAGFRAFIGRWLSERETVIMLTNKGDSKRQEINAAIQNILVGKPYAIPQQSGAEMLYRIIHESGIQIALQKYQILKNEKNVGYDVGESELNMLGYQLLYKDKNTTDAIAIFFLNTREHQGSSNAFDSLGEAYWKAGQKRLAIESYQEAVRLEPSNGHAALMLKQLQ